MHLFWVVLVAAIAVGQGQAVSVRHSRKLQDGTLLGDSVCTYAPNYECYVTGWPECCAMNGGMATCRNVDGEGSLPECDVVGNQTSVPDADGLFLVGSSVCTYAPDYECYATGWPQCCGVGDNYTTAEFCPEGEKQQCEAFFGSPASGESSASAIGASGCTVLIGVIVGSQQLLLWA